MVLTINGKEITCPDCLEWYEENGELPAQCTCGHRRPTELLPLLPPLQMDDPKTGGGFALVAPAEPEPEPMESHPELLKPVPPEFFEELYSGECQCSQQLAQDVAMWKERYESMSLRNRDYLMTNADLLRANARLNESAEATAVEARRTLVENERLRAELVQQRAFNESLDDQIGLLDQRRVKLVKMAWRMRRQRNSAIEAGRQHKSDLRESQKESAARNAWIEELQERLTSAQQRIAELEAQLAAQSAQAEADPKG